MPPFLPASGKAVQVPSCNKCPTPQPPCHILTHGQCGASASLLVPRVCSETNSCCLPFQIHTPSLLMGSLEQGPLALLPSISLATSCPESRTVVYRVLASTLQPANCS